MKNSAISFIVLLTWLGGVTISAAFWGAVGYVVYHFISKLW
jgi:hypothetical protein